MCGFKSPCRLNDSVSDPLRLWKFFSDWSTLHYTLTPQGNKIKVQRERERLSKRTMWDLWDHQEQPLILPVKSTHCQRKIGHAGESTWLFPPSEVDATFSLMAWCRNVDQSCIYTQSGIQLRLTMCHVSTWAMLFLILGHQFAFVWKLKTHVWYILIKLLLKTWNTE